jgi:hypothetical protein
MKKYFFILLGILPALTFADGFGKWTFGAWGEAGFVPLKITIPDKGDIQYTTGSGPGYVNGADAGFELGADLDKIGFHVALQPYPDGLVHLGYSAHGWVKPFNWLTLRIGRFDVADLRGTNRDGDGRDAVFSRFASRSLDGVHAAITPLKNLWVGVMVQPGILDGEHAKATGPLDVPVKENEAEKTYQNSQIGIGYRIPRIGFARAQYIGNTKWIANEPDIDWAGFEAAFNLTAVKDFDIDAGVKIPVNTAVQGFDEQTALVVTYWGDPFGVTGRVDFQIKEKFYYKVFLGPWYNLGDALSVGGDVTYSATADAGDDSLDAGIYWKKNFNPRSFIKAGLKAVLPIGEKQHNIILTIPVSFEWSVSN